MGLYEIEIEQVNGHCTYDYKEGDKFLFKGFMTKENFCGGVYVAAYPIISALEFGGQFKNEKNNYSKTKLSCPDNGNIIFRVTKIVSECAL